MTVCQTILVTGSGSSCSHGLFAPRPSPSAGRRIDHEIEVTVTLLDRRARDGRHTLEWLGLRGLALRGAPGRSRPVGCGLDWRRFRRSRRLSTRHHARRQRVGEPGRRTREPADQPCPVIGPRILRGERRVALGQRDQHVRRLPAREHRIHPRLLQRDRPRDWCRLAPTLERVMVGEHEIAKLRRLIRIARKADLERHLFHRGREAEGGRRRKRRVRAAHHEKRHRALPHPVRQIAHIRIGRGMLERRDRLGRLDRLADVAGRLVDRVHRAREIQRMNAASTREHEAGLRVREDRRQPLQHRHIHAARRRGLRHRHAGRVSKAPQHRVGNDGAGSHLGGNPLIGIEAGQRTSRTDVDQPRRIAELRSRVRPAELLRHARAPAVEEVRAERDDDTSRREVEARPTDAVALAVRGQRGGWQIGIVGHVRRHPVRREPIVEPPGEGARLVQVHECRVAGLVAAPDLAELLREQVQRIVPRRGHELPALTHHRLAVPVGVVQTLWGRLPPRTQRPAIQRVRRIPLELDDPSVASLDEQPARGGAFAARARVVRRNARHRLVRRDEVRDEVPDSLGAAPHARRDGTSRPQDLEEIAALDATRRRCGVRLSGGAHALCLDKGMRKSLA